MKRKQNRKKYTTPFYLVEGDNERRLFFGKVRNHHVQKSDLGNMHFSSGMKYIETDYDHTFEMNDTIVNRHGEELTIENIEYEESQASIKRKENVIWKIDIS